MLMWAVWPVFINNTKRPLLSELKTEALISFLQAFGAHSLTCPELLPTPGAEVSPLWTPENGKTRPSFPTFNVESDPAPLASQPRFLSLPPSHQSHVWD